MRTVLVAAAALACGFVLSAVAEQATQNTAAQQASQNPSGCNQATTADHASQGITKGGFTNVEPVGRALLVHAVDPDGNPVVMIITAAAQ
jgi:hypothetical protein